MGLLDDLTAGTPPPGGPCTIQIALETFPDEADDIWEIVMSQGVTGAHIARVLTSHGVRTNSESVNRHRRGECKCAYRMPERYDNQS